MQLCSPDGYDMRTLEGQIANIKAVRRRISSGRCVKGEPTPTISAPNLALGTQNLSEGSPVVVAGEREADVKSSTAFASLSSFCATPSVAMADLSQQFDFASFRTEPLAGEGAPGRIPFPTICRLICAELEITGDELWRQGRDGSRVFARHATWWLAKRWTSLSLPSMGRLSVPPCERGAGRDHTTVLHGIRRLEAWRAGGPGYHHVPSYAEWLERRP